MKPIMFWIIVGIVFSTISVIQRATAEGIDCAPQAQESMPEVCTEQTHGPRFWGRR